MERRGVQAAFRLIYAFLLVLLLAGGLAWGLERVLAAATFPPGFVSEAVVSGLSQPTVIDWTPDGRMFIAQQGGRVRVVQDGQLLPTDFIDISDQVNNNWNRGLVGMAIHPSFPISPYVYLLFTYDPPDLPGYDYAVDGRDGWGSRVSRLIRVSAFLTDTNVADPGSIVVLLGKNSTLANIGDPADPGGENGIPACDAGGIPIEDCLPSEGPSHSIGMVLFGHDGSLFVSNGEGAPYITPDPRALRAQNLDSLGGKVLRIDPLTGEGYADNPFYDGNPAHNRSKVWSYGHRNPFRMVLDPMTQTVYTSDVGWYSWEEINGGRAENFGWPCDEGGSSGNERHSLYKDYTPTLTVCQAFYDQEPNNGVRAPLYAYTNPGDAEGGAAVVLGAFYTGTELTYPITYHDALFFTDYGGNWIKYLTFDNGGAATVHEFAQAVSVPGTAPVHLALGPDGALYYVSLNTDPNGPSDVRRIRYTPGGNTPPTARIGATPMNGYPPLTVAFSGTGSTDPNQDAATLSYLWAFGDGVTSTLAGPTHTYTLSGTYTAVLTVTDFQGASGSADLPVTVGNLAPAAVILTPTAGMTYTMGTSITFGGLATDVEDGVLPGNAMSWTARWFFNNHFHSPFASASGASGSLSIPSHNDDTSVVLCLTVTDNGIDGSGIGRLQGEACVEILPQTVPYTFTSSPSGLPLIYDGDLYTTPFTVSMMVNAQRTIVAPLQADGLHFVSWSDGGAASHTIKGSAEAQTYLAVYRRFTWLPLVLRQAD